MKPINCILLIDDDGITNYINKRLINKLKIAPEIGVASNGIEALAYIKDYCSVNDKCCPELILLDINMPGMDGIEFLNQYSKMNFYNKEKLLIFVLTTSNHEGDLERVRKFNVAGVLNKPLTEEKLRSICDNNFN